MVVVIGAGVAGCTLARLLAEKGFKVSVIEKSFGVGGLASDSIDSHDLIVQEHGIHVLYTDNDKVVDFLSRFSDLISTQMTASSHVGDQYVPLPLNFHTIDKMLDPATATILKSELVQKFGFNSKIKVFSALAASKELRPIVKKLFVEYSKKMWGKYRHGNVTIERIPMTIGYEMQYLKAKHVCVPAVGFTNMFKKILEHENIDITYALDYQSIDLSSSIVINTTQLDRFHDYCHGNLDWRSMSFSHERTSRRLPTNAVHYPEEEVFLRVSDSSNIYRKTGETVLTYEYPRDFDGRPTYPVLNERNIQKAAKYLSMQTNLIHHIGRVAEYKHYTMGDLIQRCIDFVNNFNGDKNENWDL